MLSTRSIIVLSSFIALSTHNTSALAAGVENSEYSFISKSSKQDRSRARHGTGTTHKDRNRSNDRDTRQSAVLIPEEETPVTSSRTLSAGVSTYDVDDSDRSEIGKLTDIALKNDQGAQYTNDLMKRYSTVKHKAFVASKEFAYCMVPYRGFGPSKEGVSIITENVKKIKSLPAAEYMNQRIADDTHSQIVSSLLQMAMGLDCADKTRSDAMVKTGYGQLKGLVGEDQATKTLNTLTGWSRDLAISKTAYDQPGWDVCSLQKNVRNVTAESLHSDAAVAAVLKNITKYNKSKVMSALGIGIQTGCAIGTMFAPGMLFPMATELASSGFTVATGGNEDTKLVNELYYAKALESRWKRCNEEAQMALTNYQLALQTHSPTLMATCETVLNELIGSQKTAKILGQSYLATLPNYSRDKALAGSEVRDKITAQIDAMLSDSRDKKANSNESKPAIRSDAADKDRSIATRQ